MLIQTETDVLRRNVKDSEWFEELVEKKIKERFYKIMEDRKDD